MYFDRDARTSTFLLLLKHGQKSLCYTDDERPISITNIKFSIKKSTDRLTNAPMTNKNKENNFKTFILQASLFIASLSQIRLPFQVGMHSVGSGYSFLYGLLRQSAETRLKRVLRRVKQT